MSPTGPPPPSCKGDPALVSAQPSRTPRVPRIVGDLAGRAPTAARLLYGLMLRNLRRSCGLTEKQVHQATGFSESKISRLEGGYHDFKPPVLLRLFTLYGHTDPQWIDDQLRAATEANERGWWSPWGDVSPKALQTHVSLEDIAERLRTYEMQQLQGLLQIPDYTYALVKANTSGKSNAAVDRIVDFRQQRQHRFFNQAQGSMLCLIDEVTLVRGYGSPTVMRRQLDHLLHLAEQHPRRLRLRLVELGGWNMPVQIGSTTIFDFAGDLMPSMIYTERPGRGEYLQVPDLVDQQIKTFDRLLRSSLNQQGTVRRIQHYNAKHS